MRRVYAYCRGVGVRGLTELSCTGYRQIIQGGWDLAEVSGKAFDLADKVVGILGAGAPAVLLCSSVRECSTARPLWLRGSWMGSCCRRALCTQCAVLTLACVLEQAG